MRISVIALGLLMAACDGGNDKGAATGGDAGTAGASGGSGGASGGTAGASGGSNAGASGSSGAAGTAAMPCPDPASVGARLVGRFDGCDPAGPRFAWSGAGLVARFEGTGIALRLRDRPNHYTVLVDGELGPRLETSAGEALYTLAEGLESGEHTVEVYRRTEASFGSTVVLGLEVEDGELLDPPEPPARRIEVVGDSITCGYGNEGTSPSCPFSADTENHYLTYGALMARELEAELSTVAWSGKGVVSNYGGDKVAPMPLLYDRAVPNDAKSTWTFDWMPDAVVINLGTNDYSTDNDPSDAEFVSTYAALLERIRGYYPEAWILCTVGPLLSGADLAKARTNIAAAVAARMDAGDAKLRAYSLTTPNTSPGCDYHPSVATHEAMAAELAPELRALLGW
jgi:lysophospholipase L1-like esterase